MDLVTLMWTFALTNAPLVGCYAYDANGSRTNIAPFTMCQTAHFNATAKTNGIYSLQLSHGTNGTWMDFGEPFRGPATNRVQVLSVPSKRHGDWVFRLQKK